MYAFDVLSEKLTLVETMPASFESSDIKTEQRFMTSKDGTQVPYFLISRKAIKLDGKNPTILTGYGGFGISLLPIYMSVSGRLWLEKGGVFAFSNIRGGGEYGVKWHMSAVREKKQNSFDDFISIAENLIKTGVTSPKHLGIRGGSNGGLLVGAVFTQRPELFQAVVCEAPILDMKRFAKMNSAYSWIKEYGDPEVAEDAKFLNAYSPLHNMSSGKIYPEILFITSHNDDRVHPGHARKMAQRLKELNKEYLYYEHDDGGHFNGSIEWTAKSTAMALTFFAEKLGPFPLM